MPTTFQTTSFIFRACQRAALGLALLIALLLALGTASLAGAASESVTIVNQTSQKIYVAYARLGRDPAIQYAPGDYHFGIAPRDYLIFNGWYPIEPGKSQDFTGKIFYVMQGDGSRFAWPNRTELEGPIEKLFRDVKIHSGSYGNFEESTYSFELRNFLRSNPAYTTASYQNLDPGVWTVTPANLSNSSNASPANSSSNAPTQPASSFKIIFINKCSTTIKTAIRYSDLNDQWTTNGWVELAPGATATVANTKNTLYYSYAEIQGANFSWGGTDRNYTVAGSAQTYGFKQHIIDMSAFGTWTWTYCNDNVTPSSNSSQTVLTRTNVLSAVERIDEKSIAELLAASGDYVYWKDRGTPFLLRGQVINGRLTAAQTIDDNSIAEAIAASGDYVYWKDRGTSFLLRGKVIDGRLKGQIIDDKSTAEAIAASGDYVYWKDRGTSFLLRGKVIDGRLKGQIIDDKSTAKLLAASGDYVFWKDPDKNILFRGKVIDGHLSAVEKIDENSVAEALAASGDYVFWKDPDKNILFRGQVVTKNVTSSLPSTSTSSAGDNPPNTNTNAPSPSTNTNVPSPNTNTSSPDTNNVPPPNPPSNAPAQSPTGNNPPPAISGDCPFDVCVTDIVVSPDAPKRRQNVTFTATFVNKAPEPRYYEWLILVFDPNKGGPNKGFGESPHYSITVPPGVISAATITFPVVTGPGPCINLYVQAGTYKSATEKAAFPGSDGAPLSKYLDVCP